MKERVVVGITGASGTVYGIKAIKCLRALGYEVHVVATKSGLITLDYEMQMSFSDLKSIGDFVYVSGDIAAPIASGSFVTKGMLVLPCSIKTMSAVAYGITVDLVSRAADVALKEKRKVVMAVRETPLHSGHLETMKRLADMGAVIFPPVPAFYTQPKSVDDIVDHTVGRLLSIFGVENTLCKEWLGINKNKGVT